MTATMSAPVCLIGTDEDGQLWVMKEAKVILDEITQPVVVVSIVGLYRTGKSYLMNRLAGKQSGFALGSTIQSKTKGIWMWCLPHPSKDGHTLVLLDTEGLGDIEKGDEKHDTWIFCLALLLSSTLIYNSQGVLDNQALQKLHYVTELTENIKVKAQMGRDDEDLTQFKCIFPSFIWTVRDFVLQLEKDGQSITADEYLESALVPQNGFSKQINNDNLVKNCLLNFFTTRKCFVFPRPASDKDLIRMDELTEAELVPEFKKQTDAFCSYVYKSAKPKPIKGQHMLTGPVFSNLAEVYVEAIRSGKVLCLENAVKALAQIQNKQAIEQALQTYRDQDCLSVRFPLDPTELSDLHGQAIRKGLDVFISISFNDCEQKAEQELMKHFQSEYEDLCAQNEDEFLKECKLILKHVFTSLDEALNDGSFMHPGGYMEYRDKLKCLTQQYREQTRNKLKSEEVLSEYMNTLETFDRSILLADHCLSETEKKEEVQRLEKEVLLQRQRALEETNKLKEQMNQMNLLNAMKTILSEQQQMMQKEMEIQHKMMEAQSKEIEQLKNNQCSIQ